MKSFSENIKELLRRYFEGSATDSESIKAEEYLIRHPEVMARYEEKNILPLKPFADDIFDGRSSIRSASEYDDEQFLLLAAAAAEGDLADPMMADFLEIIEADQERKAVAQSFELLRLKPGKERWPGGKKMIRSHSFGNNIKAVSMTIGIAAAVCGLLLFGPAINRELIVPSQSLSLAIPSTTEAEANRSDILIQAGMAVRKVSPVKAHESNGFRKVSTPVNLIPQTMPEELPVYEKRLVGSFGAVLPELEAEKYTGLATVTPRNIPPNQQKKLLDNWMITGLTNMAISVAEEKKDKDAVDFAGHRIEEINRLLGWDMQLEKKLDENGELKAVSFQSGLLCFSAPVKNK